MSTAVGQSSSLYLQMIHLFVLRCPISGRQSKLAFCLPNSTQVRYDTFNEITSVLVSVNARLFASRSVSAFWSSKFAFWSNHQAYVIAELMVTRTEASAAIQEDETAYENQAYIFIVNNFTLAIFSNGQQGRSDPPYYTVNASCPLTCFCLATSPTMSCLNP